VNSAGWLNALAAVSSDASARITARSVLNASATATSAWTSDAATRTRTLSHRSATSPASGAITIVGTSVVAKQRRDGQAATRQLVDV
jgi:hypothetical protein